MRILDTFRPTDTQKQILAKIVGAATPTVAGDAISSGANFVSARNTLVNLGLIAFSNGEATLTDAGQSLARAENIVDETGGLTQEGQAMAQAQQPGNAPEPEEMVTPPQQMEAFATLKSLLR